MKNKHMKKELEKVLIVFLILVLILFVSWFFKINIIKQMELTIKLWNVYASNY